MPEELYPRKRTPEPAIGVQTEIAVCSCDTSALAHIGIKGGEVPPCEVHRPAAAPQPEAVGLNSPQLEASLTRALGGQPAGDDH